MDLTSAKEAMGKLLQDPVKCALLDAPTIWHKSLLSTQIAGVFNLIYSHIEADYPRRDETYDCITNNINAAFKSHDLIYHDGQYTILPTTLIVPVPLLNQNRFDFNMAGDTTYKTKTPGPTGFKLEMPPDKDEFVADESGYGV